MRKICPPPRSTALLPRLPSQPFPEAKGMRKAVSVAEALVRTAFWPQVELWDGGGQEDRDLGRLRLASFSGSFSLLTEP